jgi:hypothetical protein
MASQPTAVHTLAVSPVPAHDMEMDKIDVEHKENETGHDEIEQAKKTNFIIDNSVGLSKQHDLSFRATLVQFWKAMSICFGVGICAMGDGYQYKMPGNIVALPGFIRQMGYETAPGQWKLDPQHVAAWGGE